MDLHGNRIRLIWLPNVIISMFAQQLQITVLHALFKKKKKKKVLFDLMSLILSDGDKRYSAMLFLIIGFLLVNSA